MGCGTLHKGNIVWVRCIRGAHVLWFIEYGYNVYDVRICYGTGNTGYESIGYDA